MLKFHQPNHIVGMSLISVMVAAGILSAMSLFIAEMATKSSKVGNSLSSRLDSRSTHEEVASFYSSSANCTRNFGGIQRSSIPSEPDSMGPISPVVLVGTSASSVGIADGSGNVVFRYNVPINDTILISQTILGFTPTASNSTHGQATIRLRFRAARAVLGPEERFYEMQTAVTLDLPADNPESRIQSCRTRSQRSQDLCESLGAIWNPSQNPPCNISGSTRRELLVLHSQTGNTTPNCPSGWDPEWSGFSLMMKAQGGSNIPLAAVDLKSVGSCSPDFGTSLIVGTNVRNNHLFNVQHVARRMAWLASSTAFPIDSIWNMNDPGQASTVRSSVSRCRVCSKQNVSIKVVHSMTSTLPVCGPNWAPLWEGYTFSGVAEDNNNIKAYQDQGGTGSCLPNYTPSAAIWCNLNQCFTNLGQTESFWGYTNYTSTTATILNTPYSPAQISRCRVCETDH